MKLAVESSMRAAYLSYNGSSVGNAEASLNLARRKRVSDGNNSAAGQDDSKIGNHGLHRHGHVDGDGLPWDHEIEEVNCLWWLSWPW